MRRAELAAEVQRLAAEVARLSTEVEKLKERRAGTVVPPPLPVAKKSGKGSGR